MLPLSLLLLLASSTSSSTLASIPPDPFSHPKYSLSFLNDLPIEHSQAQRWIANGLPSSDRSTGGGVDVFFGAVESKTPPERMELDEKEEVEVKRLAGGDEEGAGEVDELDAQLSSLSGDGLEQIILSLPSTPPSDVQDSSSTSPVSPPTSNYTLQHLLLPPGPRSYLCLLPPPPQPLSTLPPPPPVPPMDPSLPEKLLSHLAGGCLYIKQGWFSYAYCHGTEVRQFRAAPPPWPPLPGGYVPAIDPNYDDYTLGRAAADINADQNLPPIALGRGAGQRYLVQRWGGGTLCDKTGRGREIEVQFHCSMTGTDGIGLIKEVSTCNYILIVNTPRLCNVPGFSSTHLSEPPSGISCREIVADGSIPTPKIEDGEEGSSTGSSPSRTSKDRTPLPSWAMLAASRTPPSAIKNPLVAPNLNANSKQLKPKPLLDDNAVAEAFEAILQRAIAKIDLRAGDDAAGAPVDEILLQGLGGNGEIEGTLSLKIEHDESTGEIRFVNEDGSPFDSSQISQNDFKPQAPPQPPTDLYTQQPIPAAAEHEPATGASMRAWIEKLKAQTLLDDHAFAKAEAEEDKVYERQVREFKKKAMELEDEGEREEVLRELERMEEEEEREEERLLKEMEERVKRRREVRDGAGAGGAERREVM